MIPRQQVIPFTVYAGQEVDLTFNTKYDHDKVTGVVLMPDKNIHGDTVFLEINRQTVLPRGFNAGLISFRQFLNKEIKHNTYSFEEWAQGSDIRIIYRNNSTRSVNINLLLFTVIGDTEPITKRKKLQIVPVPYLKKSYLSEIPKTDGSLIVPGREPCEVRTKTDFYFDELVGIFVDYYETRTVYSELYSKKGTLKGTIEEFLAFQKLTETFEEDSQDDDPKALAEALQKKLHDEEKEYLTVIVTDNEGNDEVVSDSMYNKYIEIMRASIDAYLSDETDFISVQNLVVLQNAVETRDVYYDNSQSYSTFELTVDSVPVYPENYPVANIIPRYRKSFNEAMYHTLMPVKEAEIYICYQDLWVRIDYDKDLSDNTYFNKKYEEAGVKTSEFFVYFLYNQTVIPNS